MYEGVHLGLYLPASKLPSFAVLIPPLCRASSFHDIIGFLMYTKPSQSPSPTFEVRAKEGSFIAWRDVTLISI
jgi:hypothetical protein